MKLIHITDLYHPPQDPDDHVDLATIYGLPELDLRAVILDATGRAVRGELGGNDRARDPGLVPVAQLNYLTGRAVSVAVGPTEPLRDPHDTVPGRQAGVELLLRTLEESPGKVCISIVSSARTLTAAFNREPELLRRKVERILLNAGSSGRFLEWNVELDRAAYVGLLRSGLPIDWYPCAGDTGPFETAAHNTYWKARQDELFRDLPAPLAAWFCYAFTHNNRGDIIRALDDKLDGWPKVLAESRNLWSTASFVTAAGTGLRQTPDGWRFVPDGESWSLEHVSVTVDDAGITAWTKTSQSTGYRLFRRSGTPEAMTEALNAVLRAAPMKPNIIFILVDDMGYGDMSLFNGGMSQTPVLDDLAREGICLTQHYAASPVCNPSRASLLTGRYPHRTGSIDTFDHLGGERLSLRERTIADILKHAGYATGLVGKFHNGTIGDAYHPTKRGFDEFFGFRGGWQFYFDSRIERNGQPVKPDGRYLTDRLTDEAIDFVTRHRTEPFFLHLAYNCPHFPIEAPAEDVAPFTGKFNKGVSALYGMIRNMDRNIGRLLAALPDPGNTIVLFTSDNGPDFGGEPTEYSLKRFNCNFNGAKGRTYEGGIRLPMIVRWPDGLPGRQNLDAMVHLSDWFPTLLAMTGVALPPDNLPLDGWDVLPVLRGESGKVNTRRFWQWNRYYPYIGSNAAMRDGDWKLLRPYAPQTYRDEDGPLDMQLRKEPGFLKEIMSIEPRSEFSYGPPLPAELYNLRADPGERNNLAVQEPARVTRMLSDLEKWFAEVEADRRQCLDAVFK